MADRLVRDKENKALLADDLAELQRIKRQKVSARREQALFDRINTIEEKLDRILNLLEKE